jgi:putative transposase
MCKSRFTQEQSIDVWKERETGRSTAKVCRRYGISHQTLYAWKLTSGRLDVSDAKRLKALEAENLKPKKLLADLAVMTTWPIGQTLPATLDPGASLAGSSKCPSRSGLSGQYPPPGFRPQRLFWPEHANQDSF